MLDGVDCFKAFEGDSIYVLYQTALAYFCKRFEKEQSAVKIGVRLPYFLQENPKFLKFHGFYKLLNTETTLEEGDVCPLFELDGHFVLFDLSKGQCARVKVVETLPEREGLAAEEVEPKM